jgi:hypothetical protein
MAMKEELDNAIANLRSAIAAVGQGVDILEDICNVHFGVKISIPKPNTRGIEGALKTVERALEIRKTSSIDIKP